MIDSDNVRPFTFGQVMRQWHSLGDDGRTGTSSAQTRSYGLIGGIGNRDWSVGAFGGTLDSRQRIGALAAFNHSDGFVAGVQGRYAANGVQVAASALFSGGDAHYAGAAQWRQRFGGTTCAAGSMTCRSAMPCRPAVTGR